MHEKPIKILLVEKDLEDIHLLEEALAEIEELQYSHSWMEACELIPVGQLAEAMEMLSAESFDVILLDLALPDSPGPDAFRRLHSRMPETPIILLASGEEEALAISLIRQGAQDYIVKPDLDCIPLARRLRCAIERQRYRSALLSLSYIDDLTGLYTSAAFHNLAERQWKLARRTGTGLRVYLLELDGLDRLQDTAGSQDRDLALILAADALRDSFEETDIIGRVGPNRFAVASVESAENKSARATEALARVLAAGNLGAARPAVTVCAATASTQAGAFSSFPLLLEAAETSLCENKRSKAKA